MVTNLQLITAVSLVLTLPRPQFSISSSCVNIQSAMDKINSFIMFQLETELKMPIKPHKIGIFNSKLVNDDNSCKMQLVIYSKSFRISSYYFKEALDGFGDFKSVAEFYEACLEESQKFSRYKKSLLQMLFRSSQNLNGEKCQLLHGQQPKPQVTESVMNKSAETKLIMKQPTFIFYTVFLLVLIVVGVAVLSYQFTVFIRNGNWLPSHHNDRLSESQESNNKYPMPIFRRNPILFELIYQIDGDRRSACSTTDPTRMEYVQDWINNYFLVRNTLKDSNSKERLLLPDRMFHAQNVYL